MCYVSFFGSDYFYVFFHSFNKKDWADFIKDISSDSWDKKDEIFFKENDLHYRYSTEPHKVCGVLLCELDYLENQNAELFWIDSCQLVFKTHGSHCNNVIKNIQAHYKGMRCCSWINNLINIFVTNKSFKLWSKAIIQITHLSWWCFCSWLTIKPKPLCSISWNLWTRNHGL